MDRALRDALALAEDRHWWFQGRRRIVRDLLRRRGASGPVAEIGCGNGANLAMLQGFGSVSAVEPDDDDRARAEARGLADVKAGALPDRLPLKEGNFGIVLALDVIEHVDEDAASLKVMAGLLRPGGTLLVTVPAYPWLWSRHDERNAHFRRYTSASLADAFADAGLVPERVSHFNSFLLPVVAAARLGGRFMGMDTAGTGLPPTPVNWSLMKLLHVESRLLARFDLPAGVSLLACASKT